MRERAPKLMQSQSEAGGRPIWFWLVLLITLVVVGAGGWWLRGEFDKPAASRQAGIVASPIAPAAVIPTQPARTPTARPPTPTLVPTIPLPTATPTATRQFGVVKADANVREQPSIKAVRIGGVSRGAVVVLLGNPVLADSTNWYQRQEGGWLSGQVVTIYPTLEQAQRAKP